MAFENLFVRTKKSIGGIELDAVLSEGHNNTARMTKNPIELGADITDHVIIEPKIVNVVAQVSDTPLGLAAFGQIIDLVTGLFGSSTADNLTRSNAAYNAMIQIMELREPIDLQTKLVLYEDMILTSLNTVQDKDSSRIVAMNMTFEEALITESEIVQLEPAQLEEGSAREQASSAEQKGRQEPVTPNSSTSSSVLKSVIDWVGG
jgi:hypothetical protein